MATAAQSKSKPKKPAASKKPRSHPPFVEMITDAIATLKERTGSSQYAITKFIEQKHKDLPPTFRKLLLHHLKRSVAAGKLVKVKNSFKLPPTRSAAIKATATAAPKKPKPAKAVSKPRAAAASKSKPKAGAKQKAVAASAKPRTTVKQKAKPAGKPKAKAKAKVAKTSPGKKVAALKGVKKPRRVKSPGKKAKK